MASKLISTLFVLFIYHTHAAVQVPKLKLYDGYEIPAIALGTWLGNFTVPSTGGAKWNGVELAVKWALEAGYRHIDTAWIYKTEGQVGDGIRASGVPREEIFVTTKLWNDQHARDSVVPALRDSLKNLQMDYVDLYLIHWPCGQFANQSYDVTDYLETWRGMMEAKQLGLAKSIGLSNFNQQQIQRILDNGLEKPAALQVELNLSLQQPELLAYCKSQGIVVTGYTPFGSLFPFKAAADAPPPRITDPQLEAIATKYNKTVPQIALRYLVELGVIPLPKSLTKNRIEQNLDIFDFQLSAEDKELLKSFDTIVPPTDSNGVELPVKWALEAGYRHIDTAWIYGTEGQVGNGVRASGVPREEVFVTTKLFNDQHARDSVVPALRDSLKNLQMDYVDLYLIHWPIGQFANKSYDVTDYLETWRGMMEAKQLGLAKSIGLSNFNQQQIQRILDNGLEKPAALQVELNLNLQQPELLAYCKSQGIVVTGYTPFGSLFPFKAAADAPPPRVSDPRLQAIAAKYNKTVPQIVLRYLVELGVIPLPKSIHKDRIEQNVDIFDFQLSAEDKELLKSFDKGYRTIPQLKWRDHPYVQCLYTLLRLREEQLIYLF
ncbi:uncharacterized protein LOC123878927 [Maniola jurtina]|uniref:uncharacterized protein LOC123878927 n=1 Tax=Maniola jurtina TaxID=191418 RepID=UPI001E686BCE|nr:uncharacterized protein LOC123878927 [Maniola jurtina]